MSIVLMHRFVVIHYAGIENQLCCVQPMPCLSPSGLSFGVSQLTPSLEVLVMTLMFLRLSTTKQEGKEQFLCKSVSLEIAGTLLVVQWLRILLQMGTMGLIPGLGRCRMLQGM